MEALTVFIGILFLGIVLYFFVSDPISFLFFALLVSVLVYVLVYYGFVTADAKPNELDVNYYPRPIPSGSSANGVAPQGARAALNEVFYVANNIFTYDQAPAVCKAYGGELADYSQVEDAYNRGAEWCGYGWTAGGVALFPTQESTWRKLQLEVDPAKRIACGRPGINGGYFDPATKFGVNCYGIRPEKGKKGQDMDKAFAAAVARIKGMLDKLNVYPFSKADWSEYSGVSKAIISAEADIRGLGSEIKKGGSTLQQSVGEVGRETVQGTGQAVVSVGGLVTDAGTSILRGIGDIGQEIGKGFGAIGRVRGAATEENPPVTQE
jgi:hypothetical protein